MWKIGGHIRAARIRRRLTQEELAERLHVSRQTISNYETGRSQPDIETLLAIAGQLGVDVKVLLYGATPPEKAARRRALLVSAGVTLAYGLLLAVSWRWARTLSRESLMPGPLNFLAIAALPCFYTLLGWTLLHAVGTALDAGPLRASWSRRLHWAVWGLLAAYFVLVAPTLVWVVRTAVETYRLKQAGGSYSYHSVLQFSPVWDALAQKTLLFVFKYPMVFTLFGGALWATGNPRS